MSNSQYYNVLFRDKSYIINKKTNMKNSHLSTGDWQTYFLACNFDFRVRLSDRCTIGTPRQNLNFVFLLKKERKNNQFIEKKCFKKRSSIHEITFCNETFL